MDFEAMRRIARAQMGETKSHDWKEKGNKFEHGLRVAKLALLLRKEILPGQDQWDDVLTAAAWFHDLRNGQDDHAKRGAQAARELLRGLCGDEELEAICGIIGVHDERNVSGHSDIVKIHQDADYLDHFGTYDIWMSFLYVVPHGWTMGDTVEWLHVRRPPEYARFRAELNYDISKRIYDEKAAYVISFAERFAVEGDGGVWDFERLSKDL